jgi:phage tail-like protein
MTVYRPTANPAFRFKVEISGVTQAVFTECILPTVEWDVQELKEGGQNTYVHQLPGQRKVGKLTLKTGLGTKSLLDWYKKCMNQEWERRSVTIILLDVAHQEVMRWNINGAFPTSWKSPTLKSDDNSVAIEELVLACNEVTVE